jgi:heat shock protein HslJ
MKPLYSILILALLLTSCEEEKTIYIADHLSDCEGVAQQKCMLVKEKKTDDWTFFYDTIEGFTYEQGYSYTLKVKISKIKNPPADTSDLRYELIEIITKEKTGVVKSDIKKHNLLKGEWVVTHISGFENKTDKSPHFTIKEGQINGSTGCNNFGGVLKVDDTGMFIPGMLRMTKMFCEDTASLESAFTTALGKATQYTYEEKILVVSDKENNELLRASSVQIDEGITNKEPVNIRYSVTSRGFGRTINLVGDEVLINEIRPTPSKNKLQLSGSDLDKIQQILSKIDATTIEKIKPPSTAHQYDGAAGAVLSIIVGKKTYHSPTFDHGNPPKELKELVEKLNSFK